MCSADRHWLLAIGFWLLAAMAFGSPRLKDLSVQVRLMDNGDARITETRLMQVEDNGTECYIVIGNMNGSRVENLQVSDETGARYEQIVPWHQDASRQAKTGLCGIVSKGDGCEVCWGLGASGTRTYTVCYTVTSLVRSYEDFDGFNYMFVADHLNPVAEHARVVISKDGGELTEDEVGMWAFRYQGDVELLDGSIVAEAADGLDSDHAMIVMLQFQKGVLHPQRQESGLFEAVKTRAFEDSDYNQGRSLKDWLADMAIWLYLTFVILAAPIVLLWRYYKIWRFRRDVNKDLMWYRDLPYKGNLLRANQVLNAMRYKSRDTKELISACVLRLISVDALRIEPLGDGSGNATLVVGELQRVRGLADTKLLRALHHIFTEASGDDGVLQPKELKKWLHNSKNQEMLFEFMGEATSQRGIKELRKEIEECRKVVGHRQFLKDFTLANERHAIEVALWKDYLVYAELFGIAKQVRRDMMKINPDVFEMDKVVCAMCNTHELPKLVNVSVQGLLQAQRIQDRNSRRDSGGGGSASMGGGGGHSGGGSGGGIR